MWFNKKNCPNVTFTRSVHVSPFFPPVLPIEMQTLVVIDARSSFEVKDILKELTLN